MTVTQSDKYSMPGLEKGLALLLIFAQQQRELSFAQLLRLVTIPKTSVYRAVQTLVNLGFLEKNRRNNTFSLGVKVLHLGLGYIASLDVVQLGQPIIEQLRDNSQCNSHLAIRDGQDIIYVARVSGAGSMINQVTVGTRLPAHRTSLGRMLLTGLTQTEFETLYPDQQLPDQGGDRAQLWQMIEHDRQKGYVIGESFYRLGISSIVYPVFNQTHQVIAVVSIMVPMNHIPDLECQRLCRSVRLAAEKLTAFLGGASMINAG